MAYLVRKIMRSKWPECIIPVDDMPADVISSDLRTQRNTLSFWRIETIDEIEKAVLALAASSNSKHIEKTAVVCVPEEDIRSASIKIDENSPGDTIIADLPGLHRDLCLINYRSLGIISTLINNNIHHNGYIEFSKKQVQELIHQAYRDNRICREKCNEDLYGEISRIQR